MLKLIENYGDKLLLISIAVYFGHYAVHDGNQFAQHIADGVIGGLLTLIVQRGRSTTAPADPVTPPTSPN